MDTCSEPLQQLDLAESVASAPPEARGQCLSRESPLMLGVLGHRELDPGRTPRLRDALTAFLSEIRQHLPDTELRVIAGVTCSGDLWFVRGALECGSQVEIVTAELDADGRAALHGLLGHPNVSCTELTGRAGHRAPPPPRGAGW